MYGYDVAIIGGGPAGLSAALNLARARRRVLVFDAGAPRNSASPGVQGFLSRDGCLPADLRRLARGQIEGYGSVQFLSGRVSGIIPMENKAGYRVHNEAGAAHEVRLVLLATGMLDEYPDIEGFERFWGHRVIHCAFCHGWENRRRRWGVLARDLEEVQEAPKFLLWNDEVMVFSPPGLEVPEDVQRSLRANGIGLESRRVHRLLPGEDGDLAAVALTDGEQIEVGTIVHQPPQRHTRLVEGLGLELDDAGRIAIGGGLETSRPGIFAAGDITPGCQDVASATAEGAKAAKAMVNVLAGEARK